MTASLAIVRAFHFASLMAIFGGSAYLLLLHGKLQTVPRSAPSLQKGFAFAAGLALLTGVLWLCLAAGQMSGDWRAVFDMPTVERVVRDTRFGAISASRLVGLALLLILSIGMRARRTAALVLLSGILLASLGLTSHAAASADGFAAYTRAANDAVHLLTAGFWIGGLLVLAMLVPEHLETPADLLAPLRLFSVWGTYAVAALVLTGLVNAIVILGLSSPRLSIYRGLLAVKVVLAFGMITLAIINRLRIAPVLARDDSAPQRLTQTVTGELALGIVVIAAAGLLGLLPPE